MDVAERGEPERSRKEHAVRVVSRSLVALAVASVAGAAAAAHYAIDVVADYLVPHASFDDFAGHDSREVLALLAIAVALGLGLRAAVRCCEIAESAGRLECRTPSWWWLAPFASFVMLGAALGVPAMEAVDARVAGAP